MVTGVLLLISYLAAVLGPLSILALTSTTYFGFLSELGRSAALAGFMMILLQPVLAGRFRWITRPFGFDIVIRYHKYMALTGLALITAHPVLLAAGDSGFGLLYSTDQPWYILLGKATLFILLLSVVVSLFRIPDRIGFERWRLFHDILFPVVAVGAFSHAWFSGTDLVIGWMRWVAIVGTLLSLASFVYHRFIRPAVLSTKPYRVIEVRNPADKVWEIDLSREGGAPAIRFLPGQFCFVTFRRGRGLPEEEHHWTVSSSPARNDLLSFTIKELGDFTATIGRTRPGDTATVHGPFGRFSFILHPEEDDLVFIAGGIGITPIMSMIRFMRDMGINRKVLLVYANRDRPSIVFYEELQEISFGEEAEVEVIHILSEPGEQWDGERGWIDSEKLRRYCGGRFEGRSYYICGPRPLVKNVEEALSVERVPSKRIHTEIFSFID